jgi:hypothetical protein
MKTIVGQWKVFEGIEDERPAEGAIIEIRIPQEQHDIAIGDGPPLKGLSYTIQLDENGRIPADTQIAASDELKPDGTFYEVILHGGDDYDEKCLRIAGPSPIDINAIEPLDARPGPVYFAPKLPRALPPRKPGVNYSGFVGGTIHMPSSVAACEPPVIAERGGNFGAKPGEFCVHAFTLPFKSVVTRVSVNVEAPQLGRHVLIGLYRMDGERVCAATAATGEFEGEISLSAGEYYLAWAQSGAGVALGGIGGQYAVANAGGGEIVLGSVTVANGTRTLPAKLGRIVPVASFVPPLAYFKA